MGIDLSDIVFAVAFTILGMFGVLHEHKHSEDLKKENFSPAPLLKES